MGCDSSPPKRVPEVAERWLPMEQITPLLREDDRMLGPVTGFVVSAHWLIHDFI